MTTRTLHAGKPATPERWQDAARRAMRHHVEVRRIYEEWPDGTELWTATSVSDPSRAHVLHVRDGIVVSCDCEASRFGDAVCVHRAAFYMKEETLVVEEEEAEEAVSA